MILYQEVKMTSITELKRNNENDSFSFKIKFYLGFDSNGKQKLKQEFGTPLGDLIEKKLGLKFN